MARAAGEQFIHSRWWPFVSIFLLSLSFRAYRLTQIPAEHLIPNARWELGAIAISLAETGQFADPYVIPTGPTAHLPPIYPAIIALFYRWFGLTSTAGYATILFLVLTGSLLYALLPWLSEQLGAGRPVGIIAGLAGAFLVEWPGHGGYPTAIALGLLSVAFLRRWQGNGGSWAGSFLLGMATGIAFHLQPALLSVVAGYLAFELWRYRNQRQRLKTGVIVFGVVLACIPWAWRNYSTMGGLFFIRSNFGLELRMGNHEGAAASMEVMDAQQHEPLHPRSQFSEAQKVRLIGEVAYMRQAQDEALAWIRDNPGQFINLTAQRIAHFWAGPLNRPRAAVGISALTILALWGAWRILPGMSTTERAAIMIPLATYPIIYYIVPYMARYRVPIDWILLILGGAALWDGFKRISGRLRLGDI